MHSRRSLLPLLAVVSMAPPVLACADATGPNAIEIVATVEFLAVEGGCWSLLASDGNRYEPRALTEPYRVHGLEVEATVRRRPDIGTVCQIGQVVEIVEIRALDTGLPPD